MLGELTDTRMQAQAYVDDIVLINKGNQEDTICDRNWIENYYFLVQKAGLRLNPSKAVRVSFTRKRKLGLGCQVMSIGLHNMQVQRESKVRYWGATLGQ